MEPPLQDIANMSWFNNVGETSSDKTILLNLTSYIATLNQTELINGGHTIEEMLQECIFLGETCGPS